MSFNKIRDLISGGFLLVLGAFLFLTSFSISSGASTGMGPAFMPRLLSGLLTVLGFFICAGGVKGLRERDDTGSADAKASPDYRCVLLSVLFLAVYMAVMKPVGFLISSIVYLFAQISLFTYKMEKQKTAYLFYAVISVVTAAAVFYIFTKGFKLMLPTGILH